MTSRRFGAIGTGRDVERAAVDQERIPGDAAGGDILVHDAAAHADEFVFRALGDFGRRHRLERQARRRDERMRDARLRGPPTNSSPPRAARRSRRRGQRPQDWPLSSSIAATPNT